MPLALELLRATRPKQWVKNALVYFPFFFTLNLRWSPEVWQETLALLGEVTGAFLLFCLLSGAVYLLNDLADAERDRHHPRKRHRPIAAGRLPPRVAAAAATVLGGSSLALSFLLDHWFGLVALTYFLWATAYSLALKRVAILDVLALSGGYVLRAVAGAVVIQVPISPWLYVVTTLGALLIGFGKRRNELALAVGGGANGEEAPHARPSPPWQQREALQDYSIRLLDQLIAVVAPATLIAYTLYTFTAQNLPPNHAMMLTIPFVLYGLFRYLYLVYTRNLGEAPEEVLLSDKPLVLTVALWLLTAALILFVFR